jgi:hypothetical protein
MPCKLEPQQGVNKTKSSLFSYLPANGAPADGTAIATIIATTLTDESFAGDSHCPLRSRAPSNFPRVSEKRLCPITSTFLHNPQKVITGDVDI